MDRDFWDDAYKDDPTHTDVPDHLLDREIKGLRPGTALDLGCGAGRNALKLAALGWSVVGVDWAPHAIALAQHAAREQRLDATFLVADMTCWEPPHKFDLVISTFALPGGEMTMPVLRRAVAALASGATLIVAEWERSMGQVWGIAEEEFVTPQEIVALLSGLVIDRAEVVRVENAFPSPDDPRRHEGAITSASVALVRAHKPAHSA